jgi:two-component system chemotaxis sensor kinase CheA
MTKDPYRFFRIEAAELLDQLGKGVLDLEKGNFSVELIMRLLRQAHTLKGAARVVKQAAIADLAHGLEDILSPHRDGEHDLTRERIDSVFAALDAISAKLAQLPTPESPVAPAIAPDSGMRVVRADLVEVDSLLDGLGEIGNELAGVRRGIDSMERIRSLASQIFQQHAMPQARLRSVSEELHILATAVERNMTAGVERIDRELSEARDAAERLRLVPVASVFNTLERTARDAAHSTGKQVAFEAIGGEVRIDRAILDTVQSALIQLVRNAVAHGIEMPPQRSAAGKSPAGRIRLQVERRGYRAYFRCTDDGAGVDIEAVRRALHKKGTAITDAQKLDAAGLMAALLKGGVSTTSVVTEISGRGIGLNLVSEAMQRLNGEVIVRTESGLGATVELWVPLTLAALEVLVVESVGHVVTLPLDAVKRTMRIVPEDIVYAPQGQLIVYEGQQIPFAPLRLGALQKKSRVQSTSTVRPMTAVILSAADTISAVAVERLCGIDTVVLRPLPAACPADPLILGVHLDGEGNPRMVLDPEVLVKQRYRNDAENGAHIGAVNAATPILIIDDSLTTRMLESSILESAGFTVEMASSAEEGLDMAHRNLYALFLVDVEMPGMDGFSFVERTQTDPLLRDVPSVLVTSRDSAEDRRRAKDCGARAHIIKGEFDQAEFLQRVAELVQR